MHSDARPRPIGEVAAQLGIAPEHLISHGPDKAKVELEARQSGRPPGRLVLVTAITPTDAGEGKTTTSIGLAQGFAKIGEKVCLALREPSLGPVFGLKGGAVGGGRSKVVPEADINLHFTGDFHAITSAHNLLAAALDNHLHFGNALSLDPRRVLWRRVLDMNDRSLRQVITGLGGVLQGVPRETGFDITPASEVMAVLCLAEDREDLRKRLGRLLVGLSYDRKPVTAGDLKVVGAMLALLKDAIKPNLVQTNEGVPAFMHGGPFANIAHGCNSVMATKMALAYADWTVTEAGFGCELGAEKFFNLKCVSAGLEVAAVVLVATVRALRRHGGVPKRRLASPNPKAVQRGLLNLEKHIANVRIFGHEPVVALNRFEGDSEDEIDLVRQAAHQQGVPFAVSDIFARGGEGGVELAQAVIAQSKLATRPYRPLYCPDDPLKTKLSKIATTLYGASEVVYTPTAVKKLRLIKALGCEQWPVCIAKTPLSLSDDPKRAGRPSGFPVTVRDFFISAGAGFLVPILGNILRMPGLPRVPSLEKVDLLGDEVVGLH